MKTTGSASSEVKLLSGSQSDFFLSRAKHPALFSGRGGGKTVASVVKAFTYCWEFPGARGVLTEPIFRNLKEILLKEARNLFGYLEGDKSPQGWIYKHNESLIHFPQLGSEILLRAGESPETLRGLTINFFGMDEARTGYQEETFRLLQGSMRAADFPAQGWVTSTPAGVRHWLYKHWMTPAELELDPNDYKLFRAHSKDNIYNRPGFYEDLLASYGRDTRWAQQEIEGLFVVFEGQAFPQFDERIHGRHPPADITRRIVGFDFGVVSPTAAIEIGLDTGRRVHTLREFYRSRTTEREIVEVLSEWQPTLIACDPTAKDAINMLRRYGLNARKARSNDFGLRVRLVSSRLAIDHATNLPGAFLSPTCPNLVEEIRTLAYAKTRGMEMLTDHFEKGLPDHAFDAFSYALMEIDGLPYGRPPQMQVVYRGW